MPKKNDNELAPEVVDVKSTPEVVDIKSTPEVVDIKSTPAVEERETGLAIPQERDFTEEALDFLSDQQIIHEFGFITMKPNRGATSFDCGSIGTLESPVEAIIIDVEPQRTLWPFGTKDTVDAVREYTRRPICSSRNEYNEKGQLLKVGCVKGKTIDLDGSEPDQVRFLVEPPAVANFVCAKCQWAEYGSAFTGAGQACKEGRNLLLWLVEEQSFVTMLITPASLRNWSTFDMGLQGRPFYSVVSSFYSVPSTMKSDESVKFSAIRIEVARQGKEKRVTKKDDFLAMSTPMLYHNSMIPMVKAYVAEFRKLEFEFEYDESTGDVEF